VNRQEALTAIITALEATTSVEGAFLSGSLVNDHQDDFSDIDLGVATKNSARAFNRTFALRHELIATIGQPIHHLDREWGYCKMIATLFGKSQFPPLGLEIDIIFSQLKYVADQMPYSRYKVVLDRNGSLEPLLAKANQPKPRQEIENDLAQHLRWFPFYMHDALKACKRGDEFQVQSLLEEVRRLIFFAAATRQGEVVYGSKRAHRYLSMVERRAVEQSYQLSDESTVAQLARVYVECMMDLRSSNRIDADIEPTQLMLQELL
jgi:predicted nucleotidyltransferase